MIRFYRFLVFIFLSLIVFSCRKDSLITSPSAQLSFSRDTLAFDTVFTTIGSATRYFIVYNHNSKAIKISDIHLAGGKSSAFRLNIDGVATNQATDVEIAAKDSLYIFAAVTVDPGNVNNPFIISDSVLFSTNGNHQHVILSAWGQDAHFYKGITLKADQTWTNDKPYVIINSILVDKGVTLTINPGCKVYNHPGSFIYVNGTLKVGGVSDSVTFQGDRLEKYYQDLPGGWGGIWFTKLSKDNEIDNAIIRDGSVGVRVDSLPPDNNPKLIMRQTIIKNMLIAGLRAFTSVVYAENCLIYNIGQESCVELVLGGIYNFKNCTFANYTSTIINHQKPVAYISNYYTADNIIYQKADLVASFLNCIIAGSLDKEVLPDNLTKGQTTLFSITWDHCCTNPSDTISGNGVIRCKSDLQFADLSKDDYKLSGSSPCIDKGIDDGITVDLNGKHRPNGIAIDIGAYEY